MVSDCAVTICGYDTTPCSAPRVAATATSRRMTTRLCAAWTRAWRTAQARQLKKSMRSPRRSVGHWHGQEGLSFFFQGGMQRAVGCRLRWFPYIQLCTTRAWSRPLITLGTRLVLRSLPGQGYVRSSAVALCSQAVAACDVSCSLMGTQSAAFVLRAHAPVLRKLHQRGCSQSRRAHV